MEQENLRLSRENLKLFVDHAASTDCAFIIDGEEIKAHKLILTYYSPVFEKMFFGKMASDRITITDITSENFSQMLQFIYTENVRIQSVLQAWSLVYIAHKYLLNDLAKVCAAYIKKNLCINNLVLNYEYAEMFGLEELQTVCINDIVIYVRGLFQENCDYHMKCSSILTIIEQPVLNISNSDLVKGILQWAVIECDINNINLSPDNVIDLLSSTKILQYLVSLDFNIEPTSEDLILKCCQLIKKLKAPYIPFKTYKKKPWCTFCKCRQSYKIAGRIELRGRHVLISNISVNHNTLLYGLVLVTADDTELEDCAVRENISISIQITAIDDPGSVMTTTISKISLYETQTYIPLTDLIYLECNRVYSIKTGYTTLPCVVSRKRSILCNYMSRKLVDEQRNIVFTFDELNGSVIKGICYYPV